MLLEVQCHRGMPSRDALPHPVENSAAKAASQPRAFVGPALSAAENLSSIRFVAHPLSDGGDGDDDSRIWSCQITGPEMNLISASVYFMSPNF